MGGKPTRAPETRSTAENRKRAHSGLERTLAFIISLMDPEFSKFVDAANDIRTSGRWTAVNAAVERLAGNPGVDNGWYVQVFGGLCFQVFSEYLSLTRAHENKREGDSSLLAWRARNLLELSVWSIYCSNGRENARRLYEDAGRDVLDVFSAFSNWGVTTTQTEDWIERFAHAKEDLRKRAKTEGIESLDGPYKQVNKAAVECGMGDDFRVSYKMLSKFAHPTAMQILASTDEEKQSLQRGLFYGKGCLYFGGAFEALERVLV